MNFKTSKDIIIRVVKKFFAITAVGSIFLLMAIIFSAESITFSKKAFIPLLGFAVLCFGLGGITSAVFIFFNCCMKKIDKMGKKTFAYQESQPTTTATTTTNREAVGNKILKEISSLSVDGDDYPTADELHSPETPVASEEDAFSIDEV